MGARRVVIHADRVDTHVALVLIDRLDTALANRLDDRLSISGER